jgi:NADH:ubiquinone oxidoreductase subunit F (NADH-binding)/(2Fe-2S) ferredoxin
MTKIRSRGDLQQIGESVLDLLYNPPTLKINIGMASCGIAAGAKATYQRASDLFKQDGFIVSATGCIGFCEQEPLVELLAPGLPRVMYSRITEDRIEEIVRAYRSGNFEDKRLMGLVTRPQSILGDVVGLIGKAPESGNGLPEIDNTPFYSKQFKIALRNCGSIDPSSIEQYIARGGYYGLLECLTHKAPSEILEIIKTSGLRGRGGGGFPVAKKWATAIHAPGDPKYIICNADEGDPGAYMDRSILEGDPHSVLEGMIIGAYTIGAPQGFIYVRNEYPLAVVRLTEAIKQAESYGLLGDDIMGTGFGFHIKITTGAGAFVCGESTALMRSLEGKVGRPRAKYIHTVEKGYRNLPSVLNNVETWANVPAILVKGADWYASFGTEKSKGTKVFSLVGKVKNTGLVEVPMGTSLREIIYDIGGGILKKKEFKAVQTGGPSGGCIPKDLLDLPVDYEGLSAAGSMMGSGGMIVMDRDTCMVDVARYFLQFLEEESCGQCVPCREGIKRLLQILTDICAGKGKTGDIELLEEISATVSALSLCALGGTAANPVLSTLRYFREEYESHIHDKKCKAGVCKGLFSYEIDQEKCNGCTLCLKKCPHQAIAGEKKKAHRIDQEKCVQCTICYESCKFGAIEIK